MTRRDEVIRMARAAGFVLSDNATDAAVVRFERFAALVAAAEREQCAKTCEALGHECHSEGRDDSEAFDCADAIRALKDGEE